MRKEHKIVGKPRNKQTFGSRVCVYVSVGREEEGENFKQILNTNEQNGDGRNLLERTQFTE
jgi:hypothetical protein